jgi:ribosomal-protein-alanine N-acetyltransferase
MTVGIRRARPADRPAVLALQSLLPEAEPTLLEPETIQAGLCLVSTTAGDRVVGYSYALPGASCAWILELVVAPAARRSGRATALLEHCCRHLADSHERVRLAVSATNDPAIACYRSLGFERMETRPELYDDGTAVVFERSIDFDAAQQPID